MALHDPRPGFDEERGCQADMHDSKRNGPNMLLGVLMAALLTTLVLVLALAVAAFASPTVCAGFTDECAAASEASQ